MTNFPASFNTYEQGAGMPGAAPNGSQMQGNPFTPNGMPLPNLPGNQNTAAQLMPVQLSVGAISANSEPTNVNIAAGTDSLLAQMSRGQVIKKDTTYGMSQFIPANGGAGIPVNATVVPVATGPASNLTYASPGSQNHTGN